MQNFPQEISNRYHHLMFAIYKINIPLATLLKPKQSNQTSHAMFCEEKDKPAMNNKTQKKCALAREQQEMTLQFKYIFLIVNDKPFM